MTRADEPWLARALLLAEDHILEPSALLRERGGRGEDSVLVFFDAANAHCCAVAQALHHAFPGFCRFLDVRNLPEAARALARFDDLPVPVDRVCRSGGVSAVLPSGIYISPCELHPKILLYELRYRCSVVPAAPSEASRYAREYLTPLRRLREQAEASVTGSSRWWLGEEALDVIARSLDAELFCILDGFLPQHEMDFLVSAVERLRREGELDRGNSVGNPSGLREDGADLLNRDDEPLKWTMWNDNLTYCGDSDPRMREVDAILTLATDALVSRLKEGGGSARDAVARRLRGVHFREETMVACYRADTRGRYQHHTDDGGGRWRCLTVILYLNRGWREEFGGQNRLYFPGRNSTHVKHDIVPLENRCAIFWANEDCPHEVLSTRRDRWALTSWYSHGPTMLEKRVGPVATLNQASAEGPPLPGVLEMLPAFFPVRPLTFHEGLRLSGLAEAQTARMSELYRFLHDQRSRCSKEDFMQLIGLVSANGGKPELPPAWLVGRLGGGAAQPAPRRDVDGRFRCGACGHRGVDGRAGGGDFGGQWFCKGCWRDWAAKEQETAREASQRKGAVAEGSSGQAEPLWEVVHAEAPAASAAVPLGQAEPLWEVCN